MTIVYPSLMSRACVAELDELCEDASCECHCHDLDGLEPLVLDEDAAEVEYDTRARRRTP